MRTPLVLIAIAALGVEAAAQTRLPMAAPTPRPAAVARQPKVVVAFEGGDYPANVARVLLELHRLGVLQTAEYALGPGEGLCEAYRKAGLPGGCPRETVALAQALNPGSPTKQLPSGQRVVVPTFEIKDRPYVVKLDPKVAADRRLLEDFEKNWQAHLRKSESLPDGYRRLTFTGFEVRVTLPSDDEVKRVLGALRGLKLQNVVVTAVYATPPPEKFHSATEPTQFWEDCVAAGGLPASEEAALDLLLSSRKVSCPVRCQDRDCPDVILIDTPVLSHPDLGVTGRVAGPATPSLKCRTSGIVERVHHGTHLAGIVTAAGNGYGVSGVVPGLTVVGSPPVPGSVTLLPIDREIPLNELMDFIGQRDAEGGLPIYLFASDWRVGNGSLLARVNDRLDETLNPLGAKICDLRPLWIAAAGDGDFEISRQFPMSPMNLGDQRNVVIVTACEDCLGADPRILPGANRGAAGQPMVQLAAPGKDIPSTASDTEYARASGTSQAAAFVAGVAAAMKACYPAHYDRPYTVKTRLQVTSRPFPPRSGPRGDAGLTAGILEAEVALLDPTKDWLRRGDGDWEPVRVRSWLRPFEILHPTTRALIPGQNNLRMAQVQRLHRFAATADGQPEAWTAYSAGAPNSGEVSRSGPGMLTTSEPVLELCGGEKLAPSQIGDLLLRAPIAQARTCQ